VGSFKADHKMKSNVTKMLMSLMGIALCFPLAAQAPTEAPLQ
jgi:hypothetical protein